MIFISTTDFWKAASNWQEMCHQQSDFKDFTGISIGEVSGFDHSYIEVTDHTVRRIKMLIGPNYKAIIKAYLIKQNNR